MKKIFLLAALAALVSCSQEDNMEEQRSSENGIYMTACDFTLDSETRTSLALDEQEGLLFSWSDGDIVGVFSSLDNQQVPLYMTDGKDTQTATFRSEGFQLSPNSSYVAYYPIIDKVTAEPKVPVDYTGQTQTGNNSYSHLPEYDYMVSDNITPKSLNNAHFTFAHVGCILRLCIEMPRAGSWSEVTLTTSDAAFTTKATLDLFGTTLITDAQKSASVSLSLNGVTTQEAGDEVTAWMMLLPADLSSKEITVTVKAADGGDDAVFVVEQGKDFKSGKAYSITIRDGSTFVDLGLTSGTLWASKNIGADQPYESGNYYGWGDVTGNKTVNSASQYGPTSYDGTQYFYESSYGTKYYWQDCTQEEYSSYDIAAYQLGDKWTMPTVDQVVELLNETNYQMTYLNGVRGFKFVNKKDANKWIFIPCAGYKMSGNLYQNGFLYVWTSELHWYQEYVVGGTWSQRNYVKRGIALSDYYNSGNDVTYGVFNPAYGFPVRPVRK